jgi:hypothetical protein
MASRGSESDTGLGERRLDLYDVLRACGERCEDLELCDARLGERDRSRPLGFLSTLPERADRDRELSEDLERDRCLLCSELRLCFP